MKRRARGLTLIEVLVALVIVAIGLLGIAGTQLIGLRTNNSASTRSQAAAIAADLAERMRANPQGVFPAYDSVNSKAVVCAAAPATQCSDYFDGSDNAEGEACTPAALAAFDIDVMACGDPHGEGRSGGVAALLPGGRFTVRCRTCPASPPINAAYDITVSWEELQPPDGTGVGGLQLRSVTMTVIP